MCAAVCAEVRFRREIAGAGSVAKKEAKKGRYFVSLKGAHTKHLPRYHVSPTPSVLTGIRLLTELRTWGSARLG